MNKTTALLNMQDELNSCNMIRRDCLTSISELMNDDQVKDCETIINYKDKEFLQCVNMLDSIVTKSSLLECYRHESWMNALIDSSIDMLEDIIIFYKYIYILSNKHKVNKNKFHPSNSFATNIQRIVAINRADVLSSIQQRFVQLRLPIGGFTNRMFDLRRLTTIEKLIMVIFVLVAATTIIVVAARFPNPSSFQYLVFRILLSSYAGIFGFILPGTIKIEGKYNGFAIRASGAVSLFILVYLCNPPIL